MFSSTSSWVMVTACFLTKTLCHPALLESSGAFLRLTSFLQFWLNVLVDFPKTEFVAYFFLKTCMKYSTLVNHCLRLRSFCLLSLSLSQRPVLAWVSVSSDVLIFPVFSPCFNSASTDWVRACCFNLPFFFQRSPYRTALC